MLSGPPSASWPGPSPPAFSGKGPARFVLYGAALGPLALRGLLPGSSPGPVTLAWAGCLAFLALAAALTDIACRRIPDCLTVSGLAAGSLLAFIAGLGSGQGSIASFSLAIRHCLLGALSLGGMLWLSGLIAGGLGGGDVKLGFALGAFLGWAGALLALLFASVAAALWAIALLALGRAKLRDGIPFGPYLALGAVLAVSLSPWLSVRLAGL